jgi:ATP-binding cassette, subfamily C, bacterial
MTTTSYLSEFRKLFSLVSARKRTAIVFGLFLLSFVDMMGLAMLVPLLALGTSGSAASHKTLKVVFEPLLERIGLTFSMETALAFFAVLILLKSAISVALLAFSASSVAAIAQKVRLRLARSILFVRWRYLVQARVGTLTHLVSSEASALGEMFHSLANLLAMVFQTSVYLIVALFVSWPAALFALALGVFMFSWFSAVMRLKARAALKQAQAVNSIAANFSDVLTGMRPMRGMGRVNRLAEIFARESIESGGSLKLKLVGGDLSAEIFEPVAALAIAAWFYVVLVIWKTEFANVLVIGLILIRVITVLFAMYKLAFRIISERQRYATILAVIAETEAQRETYGGHKSPRFQTSINFRDISFSYGQRPVLENINLFLPRGSITAIAGPSGIGKSTLIDLLLGLQQPTHGTILADDMCLYTEIDMQAWRTQIGYVPQEQFLFNDSIRSNVTLGDDGISDADVVEALRVAAAFEFVELLSSGIHTNVGERGSGLSGGQRQRICIARSLVHRPRLLILDEATTALDPATEAKVCHNIVSHARRMDMWVVVVSHQPAWIEMADQVLRFSQPKTPARETQTALALQ